MKPDQVWQDLLDLPPDAQEQVYALIAALKQRHQTSRSDQNKTAPKLGEEPFIGIWRDRADLSDSSEWVRRIRSEQWRKEPVNRGDH